MDCQRPEERGDCQGDPRTAHAHHGHPCRPARRDGDTGLRLSRAFGVSDGFWIGLQADYDTAMAKDAIEPELSSIEPLSLVA